MEHFSAADGAQCEKMAADLFRMKQCVFIIDDRTQSMPIQSVVDVETISSSTCIISTAPSADVLTPRR
uniref:Uncharacterized protein n=1 Tax=Rhodnius prolixus TaxID=13249 RepID=T1HY13_RHOPR